MNYPSISDYIEALRDAEDSLSELKDLRLVYDDQGHPVISSGNFAVVFKMQAPTGEYHALKCFLRDQEERSERYRMIAEELQCVQSTYLVKFRYLESELFVDVPNTGGEEYPVLLMDWVDGIPLDQYLKRIIDKSYEKDLLAYRFSLLARWLVTQPFAHGDLKPDNICVRDDGSLVLLDYDGMYVPALSGRKPLEQGSPHYRHPLRSTLPFDEHIDDYSLSLILLSLRAIALDETLYVRYSSCEYLLLSEQDQLNPYTSPVFKELNHLVLSLDFIDSYHTYLKSLQDTTYYLEARHLQLLAPILMYRRAAEMGDPQGMVRLEGTFFYEQGGLTTDEVRAAERYRKAADAGDETAMCNLGVCYEYGQGGLTKDEAKAVEWYRKAAEAGEATAMCNLGYAYEYGKGGLTKDEAKAVEWYQKAAEAGNAVAMSNLGNCYEYGKGGLTKDEAKAVEWYQKAAEAGDVGAMCNLGIYYEYSKGGGTKDEAKAVEWYQKAAEAGHAIAICNLGVCYELGKGGLTMDEEKAVKHYQKAAEAGSATAMRNLGNCYFNGRGGLAMDEEKAVEWYQKAAEAGDVGAMYDLGVCYDHIQGELEKAMEWYQKAAEAGNAMAMYDLALHYYNGKGGLMKDEKKAVEWLKKAAEAGYASAMFELGFCYELGLWGLTVDKVKAEEWYQKEEEARNSKAAERLQELEGKSS